MIYCMQEVLMLLDRENTCKAVFSGLARLAVLRSCIAGTGSSGRTGSAPAAIESGLGG